MPVSLEGQLVVAISSRALFDFEEENRIFEQGDDQAYMRLQLEIEDLHFHDLRHEAVSRLFELGTMDMMEIAAISGHKSLSMLKRYTHLKAQRLVRKLEGNKNKGKQIILDHLIPYPATVIKDEDQFAVKILDFDDLVVTGPCRESAIQSAQDVLLRKILLSMRESSPIPVPDQYLDEVKEHSIVMIDPMLIPA